MGRGPQAVRGGHYSDCSVFKAASGQRKRRKNARRKERTEKEDDRMTGTSHQQLGSSMEQVPCLKKRTAAQVVKNVSAFYGTRKFITLFTTVWHWTLISAGIIQSGPSQPICIGPMLVISSHVHLALRESPFQVVYLHSMGCVCVVSQSTAALSHRQPASIGISRDSCHDQDH